MFCRAGWIYQDTFADLKTLEPVLATAFADAGIRRRVPALAFNETFALPAEEPAEKPQSARKAKKESKARAAAEQAKPAPAAEDRWTGIVCTGQFC